MFNNNGYKNYYTPLNKLQNIGNNLSDFQEIKNSKNGKRYTLLGKGSFGYAEKMKSKKNNCIYAVKKLVINSKNFEHKNFIRETENMINLKNYMPLYQENQNSNYTLIIQMIPIG